VYYRTEYLCNNFYDSSRLLINWRYSVRQMY